MLWSVCVLTAVTVVAGQSVEVNTPYGALRGSRTRIGLQAVDAYLGIPYAAPPTGQLRFQRPMAARPWSGVRDATRLAAVCPQSDPFRNSSTKNPMNHMAMDEDCLYLNVYSPQTAVGSSPLPVMFFIHGGGYQVGSGNVYNGTYLATKQVVVVTVNYRLNALGFLCTEDAAIVGNYGLWDQIQALKWVRDVISAFNGNPNDVTIFGQSAGSGSVSQLIMSARARGLFHKAIMESGVSLSPWAMGYPNFAPTPRNISTHLANSLGCDSTDSSRLLACLRTKDAMAIVNAADDLKLGDPNNILFRPVTETTFGQVGLFSAVPKVLLLNDWFTNVTTIRGFNHDELAFQLQVDADTGVTVEEFKAKVMKDLKSYYMTSSQQELERMQSILMEAYVYTPNITDHIRLRQALSSYSADFAFGASMVYELELSTRFPIRPQYFYQFSYRPTHALGPQWQGATHGMELSFVFGYPYYHDPMATFSVSGWTDRDRRLADDVMTMWSNFAKYGNPTPSGLKGVTWQPWTKEGRHFLEITPDASIALKSYSHSPQDAWTTIYGLPDNPDGGLKPPSDIIG